MQIQMIICAVALGLTVCASAHAARPVEGGDEGGGR